MYWPRYAPVLLIRYHAKRVAAPPPPRTSLRLCIVRYNCIPSRLYYMCTGKIREKSQFGKKFRNQYISVSPRHSQLGFFYVNKCISIQDSHKKKKAQRPNERLYHLMQPFYCTFPCSPNFVSEWHWRYMRKKSANFSSWPIHESTQCDGYVFHFWCDAFLVKKRDLPHFFTL